MRGVQLYQIVIAVIVLYSIISFFIACLFNLDMTAFDPIRNYEKWKKVNWIGVWIGTIFLYIVYFPLAIAYWIYKLVTVGRKEE